MGDVVQITPPRGWTRTHARSLVGALGLACLAGLAGCQLVASVKQRPAARGDAGTDASSEVCSGSGCAVEPLPDAAPEPCEGPTCDVDAATDARIDADAASDAGADATIDASDAATSDASDAATSDVKLDPCIGVVCAVGSLCLDGLCCRPAHTDGGTSDPVPWILNWTLAGPASEVEADLSIENDDPGDAMNVTIGSLIGDVDGKVFDLGLSTNNFDSVTTEGRGVRFTRFFQGEPSEIRLAGESKLEPPSAPSGLKLGYNWHRGRYRLLVTRAEAEVRRNPGVAGDWFEASILYVPTNAKTVIGAFWVPRSEPSVRATISPGIQQYPLFHQLFSQGTFYVRFSDVPFWRVTTRVSSDGVPAVSARSSYPTAFPNSDVWNDADAGHVVTAFGGQAPRCNPARTLFQR